MQNFHEESLHFLFFFLISLYDAPTSNDAPTNNFDHTSCCTDLVWSNRRKEIKGEAADFMLV